jgi:hypothetical protein
MRFTLRALLLLVHAAAGTAASLGHESVTSGLDRISERVDRDHGLDDTMYHVA